MWSSLESKRSNCLLFRSAKRKVLVALWTLETLESKVWCETSEVAQVPPVSSQVNSSLNSHNQSVSGSPAYCSAENRRTRKIQAENQNRRGLKLWMANSRQNFCTRLSPQEHLDEGPHRAISNYLEIIVGDSSSPPGELPRRRSTILTLNFKNLSSNFEPK